VDNFDQFTLGGRDWQNMPLFPDHFINNRAPDPPPEAPLRFAPDINEKPDQPLTVKTETHIVPTDEKALDQFSDEELLKIQKRISEIMLERLNRSVWERFTVNPNIPPGTYYIRGANIIKGTFE
jgi:hypothetical protein